MAFSLGTRNSFVVLSFVLALSTGWETTAVVIVFQSLVELFGMVFYIWWLPRYLFNLLGDSRLSNLDLGTDAAVYFTLCISVYFALCLF